MNLRSRNKVEVQGNMSSMTDLVFLLMIFFIVLSTLAKDQYTVDLPNSNGITEPVDKANVSVAIGPDSKYYVDAELQKPLGVEEVKDHILKEQQAFLDAGKEEISLRINADVTSEFEAFSELMTFAKQNDLKVVIVTQG